MLVHLKVQRDSAASVQENAENSMNSKTPNPNRMAMDKLCGKS